jgi:hypothetical protein
MIKPAQYVPEYDVAGSQFDLDLQLGRQGEALTKSFLAAMAAGTFEVKTDRYRNGRMIVETEHLPIRQLNCAFPKWELSGINTTKATFWVYVYTLNGAFVVIDVSRLKRYLRANPKTFNWDTKREFGNKTNNPSRGWLLEPEQVMDLMTNAEYDGPTALHPTATI